MERTEAAESRQKQDGLDPFERFVEIATKLIISEGTVKNHISNLLGRLQLRDRTQAAIYARDMGLL